MQFLNLLVLEGVSHVDPKDDCKCDMVCHFPRWESVHLAEVDWEVMDFSSHCIHN